MAEARFVVEPMAWRDIDAVMEIERQAFPLPWPKHAYRHELFENEHSHYQVLRRVESGWKRWLGTRLGSSVVGYGGFWMIAGEAHISTLAIDVDWRGRGLGSWLLWHLLERASQLGAFEATLEVRVSNLAAQALYSKFGFVIVGERRHYYQDNGEDAWIMTVREFDGAAYQARLDRLGRALQQRVSRPEPGQSMPVGL